MNQDLESEKAILAALYEHGKDALVDISDIIKDSTFSDPIHQVFFLCFEKAISKSDKVSYPLLLSSANELGLDDTLKENQPLLEELKNGKIEINHVRILAKKLGRLEIARIGVSKLQSALSAMKKITGDETASSILSVIEKPGYEVQEILSKSIEDGGLIGKDAQQYIEALIKTPNREIGISTGFKEYDKAIGGGIRRGGFALIGVRRKIGKSALSINIGLYVATKLKVPVLYLDTEMQAYEHLSRMHANLTNIPINTIEHATFTGNNMLTSQLREAAKKLENIQITHERVAGKPIDEILAVTRRWLKKTVGYHSSGKINNCLVIYDYFKLMDNSNMKYIKEWEALGIQATSLSNFCGDFDIPCLALVQLNRESDIAQSDRLSWLATSVVTLLEKTPEEIINDGYENGNRKIVFDVARFGGGLDKEDYINVDFNGELCQMRELGTARQMKADAQIGKSGFKTQEDNEDDDNDPVF